ncbi:hypothetical protein C8F01DRAFT_1147560 [Mycena amicta]|nr:hypothetical protein C8F01DRAFT_1147560 [Mycena amicta]
MARLPPELERDIFELSARAYRSSIPAYLRVAHRVHVWIEPLLYDVLLVELTDRPTPSETRTNAFLSARTRSLSIYSVRSHERLLPILAACTGTTNLALWASFPDRSFLPLLEPMSLTRLTVDVQYLFGGPLRVNLTHPALSQLTHLDIIRPTFDEWRLWSGLALMPALTHLAFRDRFLPRVFEGALAHCKNLKALGVVWSTHRRNAAVDVREETIVGLDARFFMVVCESRTAEWEIGARRGRDFWKRAEELIARKESGQMKVSRYWVGRL